MTREEFNQKKVWLWRYQRSRNHARQLRQQIQSERERATATTKALSPVVVSAGGKNKIEDAVCRIMERQEALYKQIIETEMQREEIETAINSAQDQMQRDVLRERYIVGTPYWWKIAINLNISERWAKKLHRAAIENLCTPVHF